MAGSDIEAQMLDAQIRAYEEYVAATPDRVLAMLAQLRELRFGGPIDQLSHVLQTATRAHRANASDELLLCALCHDLGKLISPPNHAAISAEILQPYVSEDCYRIVTTHQLLQGQHMHEHEKLTVNLHRDAHRAFSGESWYERAVVFCSDWDEPSFESSYPSMSLQDFEPLIRRAFAAPLHF